MAVLLVRPASSDSSQYGTLEGRVSDSSGSPSPGVSVTLESERGKQTDSTDAGGVYRFGLLTPGSYTVAAQAVSTASPPHAVRINSGQRHRQDLILAPATEEITVVATASLINEYEVSAGATLPADIARELPFQTRNYSSATTILPGVVHNTDSQRLGDSRPALNGSEWQENAAFIDGVDTSNTRRGGSSRILLATTAVAEVRIDSSGAGAEYGRVTGGVTGVVTKSGTNQLHGEGLYIAQNQAWRAQSDFVPVPRQYDLIASYELALGGPLIRDRLWFFAAYARNSTNEVDRLGDGSLVDTSIESEPRIFKLSSQLASGHALAASYIDAPAEKPQPNNRVGDVYALPLLDLSGEFLTASWSTSLSSRTFLEARFADQTSTEDRTSAAHRELEPATGPPTPLNTTGVFTDIDTLVQYGFVALPLGEGQLDFPRTQANAALTWLLGADNELKLGVDYQDLGWDTRNIKPRELRGRGYGETRPGGFTTPLTMREFIPATQVISTDSIAQAAYAQDRVTIGERWTFTLGARLEDQEHRNDVGTVVASSTDVSPRVAVAYDADGAGRLLVKATAGRYYNQIPQEIINTDLSVLPNGTNAFDEFAWNPATQQYDLFLRRFVPSDATVVNRLEGAYHKDEATAGIEWQLARDWALEARGIYWKLEDLYWGTSQIAADGAIFRLVATDAAATRDYRGLQLEANRSFRDGWVLRTNYTWSRNRGNLFGNTASEIDNDDFLEASAVVNPATEQPYTAANRFGRGRQDREHIVNVAGVKRWNFGRHELGLGGLVWFRSGERWGLRPVLTLLANCGATPSCVSVPGLAGSLNTSHYVEPRDANQLDDLHALNLVARWTFPLGGGVAGQLEIEVTNVTDEQEQIDVVLATGRPPTQSGFYSLPREYRAVVGVSF
jgi:hypothetical protein